MNNLLPDSDVITKLFDAYNSTTGFGVQFNVVWERQLYDSARMGLTPEMLVLVIKDRLKGIKRGDRKPACLMPRNLFASDEMISEVLCEAAALLALQRKVINPAKESVLKSWRPLHETETPEPRMAKEVLFSAIDQMRKAAQ